MTASVDSTLVRDLSRAENLPGPATPVEVRTTHGSHVFLAGESVFKIKRPVDYGFLDYSSPESRRHFCEEELRLNRRGAPDVYLEVLPVYRDARGHSLTRRGEIADWAVHMRRLPDDQTALAHLRHGSLGPQELRAIARRMASYYRDAPSHAPDAEAMADNVAENFRQLASFPEALVDPRQFAELRRVQETWLARHRSDLQKRKCVDGHGDLRLEHVYLAPSGVLLLDCIEFSARFRVADPALDAAFLAMDLHREGHGELADYFLGRFASETHDFAMYPLLDGYMAYRATVRCKVAGLVASDPATPPEVAERKAGEARDYLHLAIRLLTPTRDSTRLVAVGGIIGSGKTTVAEQVSAFLHAPAISADATRKHLAGIEPTARGSSSLYTPEFTAAVQGEVLRRAESVLRTRRHAVLDTTCASRAFRRRILDLANRHDARFTMLECTAPEEEIRRRLRSRNRSGSLSDAREDLLPQFTATYEPMDEIAAGELFRVDTSQPPEQQRTALVAAQLAPPPGRRPN